MRVKTIRAALEALQAAEEELIQRAEAAESALAEAKAEARRFYNADGSYVEMEPHVVVARRKAAAAEIASLTAAHEVMIADLGALLRTLGMFDGARNVSPHEVMLEAIGRVAALTAERDRFDRSLNGWCEFADQPGVYECNPETPCRSCAHRINLAALAAERDRLEDEANRRAKDAVQYSAKVERLERAGGRMVEVIDEIQHDLDTAYPALSEAYVLLRAALAPDKEGQ